MHCVLQVHEKWTVLLNVSYGIISEVLGCFVLFTVFYVSSEIFVH